MLLYCFSLLKIQNTCPWFQVALQMSLNEDDDNEVPALPKSPTAGVPQPAASAAPGEILDQRY